MPINEMGARQPWFQRAKNLKKFFTVNTFSHSVLVDWATAKSEKEILQMEENALEQGYEGVIVRTLKGDYIFGHRSKDLLKVKTSQDAEFKIIGFDHGVGKFSKAIVWKCETKEGKPFNATPKATQAIREKLYSEGKKHVGKWLKVRFQNYTVEGKPRFGRSLGFRDPIDMD